FLSHTLIVCFIIHRSNIVLLFRTCASGFVLSVLGIGNHSFTISITNPGAISSF
ncbi:unnamed protein product, partial [Arabidopsis halleri]